MTSIGWPLAWFLVFYASCAGLVLCAVGMFVQAANGNFPLFFLAWLPLAASGANAVHSCRQFFYSIDDWLDR